MIGLLCLRRSYKYDRIHYVFGSSVPLCVRVYAYVRASVRALAGAQGEGFSDRFAVAF